MESLNQCRRLEVPEKVRNVVCDEPNVGLTTRCYTTSHLHQVFFDFARIFSLFVARISYFKFLEFKEFNKTIIPFALVGYDTGYSQLGATRLVGYLPSHIQRALME